MLYVSDTPSTMDGSKKVVPVLSKAVGFRKVYYRNIIVVKNSSTFISPFFASDNAWLQLVSERPDRNPR